MLVTRPTKSTVPQPLLFSRLTDIVPHVRFACFVGSEKLVASVTHVEDTGTDLLYHVSFSDGHKDAYSATCVESGRMVTLDSYAQAIQDDLWVVHTLRQEDRQPLVNFRIFHDTGHSMNVWIEKRKDTYRAYFNGAYQFHFRKRAKWEVRTSRTEKEYTIDRELSTLIEQRLEEQGL